MMELQGQHDAVTWFKKYQLQSVITNGLVPEWFHGIIPRKTAEDLLMSKPPGNFLIRVSESRIGYTLSYRAEDRCRHFMIDALEDGQYIIVGENRRHLLLQDLVDFHRRTPIMPFTQVLTVACGQSSNDTSDYAELLFPQKHPTSNSSLPLNNLSQPSVCSQTAAEKEEIPPALPHRPNDLNSSRVLLTNRLYPCLDDECPHTTTPLPAKPVPMTRKKYTTDQPPEVPARSGTPLNQNQVCIRTVSVPDSPSTSNASEQAPTTNNQRVKNPEAKGSVIANFKNLRKKFQRNRSISQNTAYAEIRVAAADNDETAEHEYQEIEGGRIFTGAALSRSCNDVRVTDKALPQEYLPPPPFAPGY